MASRITPRTNGRPLHLQPKHLDAICLWEGAADFYRDMAHHGGIFCRGFVRGLVEGAGL